MMMNDKSKNPVTIDDTIMYLIETLRAHPKREITSDAETRDEGDVALSHLSRNVGVVYEKVRYAIDNKEEHFLRRHAIRRIIKRITLLSRSAEEVARLLVRDLRRSGYLPQKNLHSDVSAEVISVICFFLDMSDLLRAQMDTALYLHYRKYLLDLASGLLEDVLYNGLREDCIVIACANIVDENLSASEYKNLSINDRRRLSYIASWRSIFSADSSLLFYKLWILDFPHWSTATEEELRTYAVQFPKEVKRIHRLLSHELGYRLVPRLHDASIAFTLLYDAVREYDTGIETILRDKEHFASRVKEYITRRAREDIKRAKSKAWRAVLYIFITKSALAATVESIYVFALKEALNWVAIAANVIAHPALLLFITSGLGMPGPRNSDRAAQLVSQIVYDGKIKPIILRPQSHGILHDIALGAYVVLFTLTIGGIIFALKSLNFHSVDIGFFLLFLALVLYFGFRIRYRASRMVLKEEQGGYLQLLAEILVLPIISLGRWLTIKFEGINVAVFFLDVFIEVPMRFLLEFLDSFSQLVKEKKEEMYS